MIEPSKSTKTLIEKIDTLSGKKLTYKNELAVLIDLVEQHQQVSALDQLSFLGKFVHKAFAILKRTGKVDEDRRRLTKEFEESIEKIKKLINDMILNSPPEVQKDFSRQFLEMTPESFDCLLVFCKDLSWYKNYRIDTRRP